jgi:NAD(P)-dependent dehydrogenase (short-subunit alcohol dehydrogenase family)
MLELNDRVAVITGAASGFGRELARACAAHGMRLVLADIKEAGLFETAALLPPDIDCMTAFRMRPRLTAWPKKPTSGLAT